MKNYLIFAAATLALTLQGCATAQKQIDPASTNAPSDTLSPSGGSSSAFVVSILGGGEAALTLAEAYMADLRNAQETHGGEFATSPIKVEKQLTNPWLPESASAFPGNFVLIERFPDAQSAQSYLTEVADEYANWDDRLGDEIRFLAAIAPNPGPDPFPVIGSVPSRGGESFILLNGASFFPPEESQPLISQYFQTAGPIVGGAGTQFLASLANVAPITGEFPHQILFLSEWASEAAFESVHNNSEWQAVAPFRNQAVTSFTEAKGVILQGDR